MLNTVYLPTKSACEYCPLTSAKFFHLAFLAAWYQDSNELSASGYSFTNSLIAFLLIMCTSYSFTAVYSLQTTVSEPRFGVERHSLITTQFVTYYCGRECPSFSIAFRLRLVRAGGC